MHHDVSGGGKGHGSSDDFVARSNAGHIESEFEASRTGIEGNGVLGAGIGLDVLLKTLYFGPSP